MPRKHRAAREREGPPPPDPAYRSGAAPEWARLPGHEVRAVVGDKVYRCPWCDQVIRAGVQHLVVVPEDRPDERRHWHTECWRRELRGRLPRDG
ncbi:MAG: hypothetical protein HY658_00220 [Actinobacteria bacterium]|nr:hypothetical protein [Actinomycetota bacterium]